MSGGGSRKLGLCWSVSLYGVSRDVWKTSWIFQVGGNLILYVTLDIWETTSKGPYLLGDNLGVMLLGSCRFVPSNQTLDLTGNGE